MKNKIYLYELDCYKNATEEQKNKMRICENRYFDLNGLPSESIRQLLEEFIWERGKCLAPSSLNSEFLYYNNIRDFLIECEIEELQPEEEQKIIRLLKKWMLKHGYALTSQKYKPEYDKVVSQTSCIEKHLKKLLRFAKSYDGKEEQEKDIWELHKFDFPMRINPIKNVKTLNFTKIPQRDIRKEVKEVIFMHLKHEAIGTILAEIASVNRFTKYLKARQPNIISLLVLGRKQIEEYLIYLQTEARERKNYRSDLYALRRVIEDVGCLYERHQLCDIFLNNDFPNTPRYLFKFYSDAEIKRLNEHIFKMDEQICRALVIHQLLGTRISDTLTLKIDCLSKREGRYFIRIEQVKSITYEKAISDEVGQLVQKAIDYTKRQYGDTEYIFVKRDDPAKPYQYSMLQNKIMKMIRQEDIRDDHGELMTFGTHIYRHCYGKKLTEMQVEDWMIAKLLGHKTLQSVHYYRRIGNKMMADETRKSREKIDKILAEIIIGWDGYEL